MTVTRDDIAKAMIPAIRASARIEDWAEAIMPLIRRVRAEGFKAGWVSSGEGFNGEYPDEGVPWEESAGRAVYDRWIEKEDR